MKKKIGFFDEFNQTSIQLSNTCNLKCGFCHLATDGVNSKSHELSSKYVMHKLQHYRLVNLIGGEPLNGVTNLRQDLNKKNKIRLFTNLSMQFVPFEKLLHTIDEWVIYLPVRNKRDYRLITAYDSYQNVLVNLKKLYTLNQDIVLNVPIFSNTLTYVPDIHELARSLNAKLWLNYNPKDFFDKESKGYIQRYRKVKNVRVFKISQRSKSSCPALPYEFLSGSKWSLIQNLMHRFF